MGTPHSERLRLKIVQQFQNNVPQREIAKNLGMSASTVHNIIKRFRESGGITVRKGQGRKPILDVRELRALKQHCIQNRHDTVVDITAWAQKHFKKTLSVNTVRRYIQKCVSAFFRSKESLANYGSGEDENEMETEESIAGSVDVQTQASAVKSTQNETQETNSGQRSAGNHEDEASSVESSLTNTDKSKDQEEAGGDSALQEHYLHKRRKTSQRSEIEKEGEGSSVKPHRSEPQVLSNNSSREEEDEECEAGPADVQKSLQESADQNMEEEVTTSNKIQETKADLNSQDGYVDIHSMDVAIDFSTKAHH
ncbi:uncharacterized protein LOC121508528 [Cheilinus undulatus]|uniref:uncharacterized protein LOC121508528 n=1 Tax=Cheilinus undulatus TaxID=241271 RepID=UPI001BD59B7F|nr:uncharacterized protein LOC121508528 [Cheilinus undulatus]